MASASVSPLGTAYLDPGAPGDAGVVLAGVARGEGGAAGAVGLVWRALADAGVAPQGARAALCVSGGAAGTTARVAARLGLRGAAYEVPDPRTALALARDALGEGCPVAVAVDVPGGSAVALALAAAPGPYRGGPRRYVPPARLDGASVVTALAARAERAPARGDAGSVRARGVFTVSAESPEALARALAVQAEAAARSAPGTLGARCWTSNHVLAAGRWRWALPVPESPAALAQALAEAARAVAAAAGSAERAVPRLPLAPVHPTEPPAVAYLVTGTVPPPPGRVAALARACAPFGAAWEAARGALRSAAARPSRALPAAFAVQYATGRALAALGVAPGLVAAAGAGEYAAACLAGALRLADAARLVAARDALDLAPGGALAAVAARGWERALAALPADTRPRTEYASATLGGRLLERESLDADFWRAHLTAGAHAAGSAPALHATLTAEAPTRVLDLGTGPGALLAATLPPGSELAHAAAELYGVGLDVCWSALYAPRHRVHEPLPPCDTFAELTIPQSASEDAWLTTVREAVVRVSGRPPAEIDAECRLYEDLGFDSVTYMALVDDIARARPEAAGALVLGAMVPALRSVGALAGWLRERCGAVAA
jgi:SAM-dependent methyltransferase